jgi:hypothetical protein
MHILTQQIVVEQEVFDTERRRQEDQRLMAKFADVSLEAAGADANLNQLELDT